jgi:hypothetical protein
MPWGDLYSYTCVLVTKFNDGLGAQEVFEYTEGHYRAKSPQLWAAVGI